MSNRGSPPGLPHSFLCLMKTDFSEQVEKLRKEITAAIKAVLEKYGKTEMEFPDTVDAVYVIWFDHDGDPYECLVRRIQFFGEDLVASTGWTRYSGQPYSFYPIPIQKPNRKIMMETIIIDRICTSCGCDKDTAREYLDAEVRNLRELRDANDLREGDLESACDNLCIE